MTSRRPVVGWRSWGALSGLALLVLGAAPAPSAAADATEDVYRLGRGERQLTLAIGDPTPVGTKPVRIQLGPTFSLRLTVLDGDDLAPLRARSIVSQQGGVRWDLHLDRFVLSPQLSVDEVGATLSTTGGVMIGIGF